MDGLKVALGKLPDFAKVGRWGERIASELRYCYELSRLVGGRYDDLIESAIAYVDEKLRETGTITAEVTSEAEHRLDSLREVCKKYELLCAAHAHIDMNWMWRWDETVSVTLDTFRTMLDLMEEYPEFTFSQSQASVYEIVEKYDPEMLEEIKRRVHEGRWEVTASAWVEADKNMPNGESMARHILYTRQYLSQLLDLDPKLLTIAFEPDTFGHNVNVPEILSNGGVKYYYHCRGAEGEYLERWAAPSGNSIIVYREPFWYNADIEPAMAYGIPEICEKYGLRKFIKVYGVGDHGGGPTRRDIERIIDMGSWPLFPRIKFGTFAEFFHAVEEVKDRLTINRSEKNFIFTGCYTSQSRIKMANRVGEATLNEAELYGSMASIVLDRPYKGKNFAGAWRNILFNQFHDIIPGSCVIDSREHAMGLFQEAMALANSAKKRALLDFCNRIDTTGLFDQEDARDTRSEGAGAGFGVEQFRVSQSSRGAGKTRVFHVFNSAPYARTEVTEVVVWDWDYDLSRVCWQDAFGNEVDYQVLEKGKWYWGHTYVRMLVELTAPACGYSTYVLTERPDVDPKIVFPRDPRVEKQPEPILENELLKAVFDARSCTLRSLVCKQTGEELIGSPAAVFRLVDEDITSGTAWRVGRYMRVEDINFTSDVKLVSLEKGDLRQTIVYEMAVRSSKLRVTVTLDKGSPRLDFAVECDWQEIGNKEKGVPQLNFYAPLAYECRGYKYDVPFGVITREPLDMDVPANSWAAAPRTAGSSHLVVVTDSKYGFRGVDNALAVTLLRSSFDPDPYPENGKVHRFRISLVAATETSNRAAIAQAYDANHPFTVISARKGSQGSLPSTQGFLQLVEGPVAVAAVKCPEDNTGKRELVIRVYETEGSRDKVTLAFAQPVREAAFVDINEERTDGKIEVAGKQVTFQAEPHRLMSLRVELKPFQTE